ncbi:MAG: carboxylate-amine ligase [Myxococcales bacterium]|nr:carboxylate-amine ligase [Myxococcales bacterium]
MREPTFTLGIEEEYLLIDRLSRDLVQEVPKGLLAALESRVGSRVAPEFLQCQIEVGTGVCARPAEARAELVDLRATLDEIASEFGCAIVAASTHPFANWGAQRPTDRERYQILARDLQEVVRRLVIGGMHVHVGIDDDDLRIDLMSQATYILPHLLALSTSSPFWEGHRTGLMSYRIAVWDELPRTGLPEAFESHSEYQRHVSALIEAGVIEDATKIWWDIRPSARFPTLEMRLADVCTNVDDAICIAAVYLCWLRMLYRLRRGNQRWRRYSAMLISENRWRAQRYSTDEGLIDFGRGAIVPYHELLNEILDLVAEDAAHFGAEDEIAHARTILARGTSAHAQLRVYDAALSGGASPSEALRGVVDWLVSETLSDGASATR